MLVEVKQAKAANWRTIYSFINKLRQEPEHVFMHRPNPKDFTAYIIYLDEKPIGFATWNLLRHEPPKDKEWLANYMKLDENKPCLRQIYIISSERRKGFGLILFRESRKHFTKSQNLYVESPNKGTAGILVKLGIIAPANSEGSHGKNGNNNVWFINCG